MVSPNPLFDFGVQRLSDGRHLLQFAVGNSATDIVVTYVALFAEGIKGSNKRGVFSQSQRERLDYTVMVAVPRGAIAGCGKGGRGGLQSSIVGDGKPPIVGDVFGLAVLQVSFHDTQKIRDLFLAALVNFEPAILNPVFEAHLRLQSRIFSSHVRLTSESGSYL